MTMTAFVGPFPGERRNDRTDRHQKAPTQQDQMGGRQESFDVGLDPKELVPQQIENRADAEHADANRAKTVTGRHRRACRKARSAVSTDDHEHPGGRSRKAAIENCVPRREERFGLLVAMGPSVDEEAAQHPKRAQSRHGIVDSPGEQRYVARRLRTGDLMLHGGRHHPSVAEIGPARSATSIRPVRHYV